MGEFCSKPESGNSQSHSGAPPAGTQNIRSRDNNVPNAPTATAGFLSNMCDTVSRLQSESHLPPNTLPPGSRMALSPEQTYAGNTGRNGRSEVLPSGNPTHPSGYHTGVLTPEDMLAAAQICSHLSQSQLNALAAAYHHQQQQIQRSVGSVASGTTALGQVPGSTFAQALGAVTSISKSTSPAVPLGVNVHQSTRQPLHLVQSQMNQSSQKRPPSGQSQFHSSHSAQMGSTTSSAHPASASQTVPHHRGNHPGPPGFGTMSSHGSLSQSMDPNSNLHNTHHQTRASPSLSPSPGSNIYQTRRSQLAPPPNHPNKRPRILGASKQPHAISSIPPGHATNTISPAGMEAILGSVVASKAMASLAAGSNFLNPNAYSAATEAAAAALTPFYTSINNANVSNPSAATTPNQVVYQPHTQHHCSLGSNSTSGSHLFNQQHVLSSTNTAYGGSLVGSMPSSLFNSLNNRPAFSHATVSTQAITSGQALVSTPGLGSQSVTSHPPSSHLSSKAPHPTAISQSPSRLISGHLHHPHVPTHPSQNSFHQSNHPLPQPNSQHHMMGHSNLPQGSGVLRQQTKEPAYHPQVEAISPAPDESRLADAQDAKLHREREEINRQLTVLDADINKQESHLRNLCEREARLTARLAAAPARGISNNELENNIVPESKSEKVDVVVSDASFISKVSFERNYENPIQAIISENRQRTRQRHLIFTKLCGPKVKPGPYALPFYRQPSDLPSVRATQSSFRGHFRAKLVLYLQRRLRAEHSRIQFLAQQYERNSKVFTKKMDKLLSTTKRRQRDLRHRDIFEKALPEVKKNREDREMGGTEYSKPGIEDADSGGISNMADGSQTTPYDAVEEMNKLKEYAIDPPVMLAPWQHRYQFICESGLITDCRAQLQETQDLSKWSEEEKQTFKERFLATPKNFTSIAAHLERKSVAECIRYYYLSKKKEGYKQLLKKHNARRRRAAQTERGGGGTGGASGNSNVGGSGSGHGNNGNHSNVNSVAPPAGSCQNGHTNINSPRGDHNESEEKDISTSRSSQFDSSGFAETHETSEVKDAYGCKNPSRRETLHGNTSGARSRTGRGRPPQHCAHSHHSSHGHNTGGSHGRNRSVSNCCRMNANSQTNLVPVAIKECEPENSLPKLDKELPVEGRVKSEPDSYPTSNENPMNTSKTLPSITSPSGGKAFESSSNNSESLVANFKNSNPSTMKPASSIVTFCLDFDDSVKVKTDTPSTTIFPSTTAAEIYAAAARYAAVSANACGLNPDSSSKSASSSVDSTASCNLDVSRSSLPNTILSSSSLAEPQQSDFPSTDAAKKKVTSQNPSCGPSGPSQQSSSARPMDPSASSKAILIGDFLTAQQLGRTYSSNWGNSHINSRPVDYTGSCQMSRSIDPSTLPLPVSHPSQSSTALHNFDRHPGSEYRSGSLVCEKGLGIDFFAEHAIRLAMQAKAAAASVAAAQLEGHVSTSIVEKNFSTERCVYSPLSPTPVKIDCLPATTNRSSTHQPILTRLPTSKNDFMYPSAITFPDQLVNNSDPDPKQDNNVNFSVNAAQVASFVANADRLYLEEVASYTSRDRSDSMQTLTSSEASQLYGVLQHLRQQKQEFGSRHPPNTGHGFESNINISVPNIRSHRLENADKGPARPHSSEDASDHSLASLNENEIVGGTHSKIMNNTFPAISQTQSFGFPSPNFNEESHGSRKSASRIGHSTFLPDSVDPSCDPSTLISEARYRRRGYTESQINRRHISTAAGCNTDYNATGDHLAPTQSELPNKLPSVDEKSDVNLTSFTTATYIDALINSHLSRSTNAQNNRIRTPCNLIESGRSQSDSLTSFNTSSFSKCSLPELTVEESKLHNYRPDHLNKFHPDVQSQSTTGKHASLPIGSNTLESQINKAIAEEIRAQGVSRNSLSSNMCSPHQSRTPSPVNKFHATRNSDSQMFNLSVPPKKQDRSISRSPGVLNCLILSGSRDPLSNSAPKMSTHEPPVGKVSSSNNQDTVNKSNQKPANKVYDVVEEKRKASELMNKTSLTAIDSPANHSSSPSSDMESPGLLQIDLAVAEYSPKVALESSNSGPPVSSHSKDIHNFFSSNKNLNCIQSVTECGCDDSSGR